MKQELLFRKHLTFSNAVTSALTANTTFHSIDHYNMGKYFLNESKEKRFKANDLVYIESWCYGSRISADCQQKLFSPKPDASGRFLPITFLKKQKREDG